MTGVTFAVLAAFFNATYALIARSAGKQQDDIKAWAITYQYCAGVLYLIPAILFFRVPDFSKPYYYFLLASLVWSFYIIVSWMSHKETHASIRQTLNASKNIFVVLFAFVLIGESITLGKIVGMLVIIFGILLLSLRQSLKQSLQEKGFLFTIGSSVSQSIARVLDKIAIPYFSTPTYSAMQFFFPAFWVSLKEKNLFSRIKKILMEKTYYLVAAVIIGGAASFFQFESYRRLDVGTAVLIMELSTVLVTLGGVVFLREKGNVGLKIASSIIVTIGVVLITFDF